MEKKAYGLLVKEVKILNLTYEGKDFDRAMATCLCGKVHFAAELGLITIQQWEELFGKAAALTRGK